MKSPVFCTNFLCASVICFAQENLPPLNTPEIPPREVPEVEVTEVNEAIPPPFGMPAFETPTQPTISTPSTSLPPATPAAPYSPTVSSPTAPRTPSTFATNETIAPRAPNESIAPREIGAPRELTPPVISSPAPPILPTTPTPPPTISSAPIIHEPSPALIEQRPELFRSVSDPQHPFFGLVGMPRVAETRIQGEPLTLFAVLQSTRVASRRLQRIVAYWDCAEALASYHLKCAFEFQLQTWIDSLRQSSTTLPPSQTASSTAMLDILAPALRLATSERRAAEIRFIQQQNYFAEMLANGNYRAELLASGNSEPLPVPSDFPLVKAYDTKIDALAQQRGVSARARELDLQIPLQHLLIGHERDATVAAEELFGAVYERRASLMESLVALRQVMTARQNLVSSVCAYNKMIAEYVTETIGNEAGNYRLLVALLELPPMEE